MSTSDQQPCHEPGRRKEARPLAQGWLPGQEEGPCCDCSRWPENWVRMVLVTCDLKEGQSWARSNYGVTPKAREQKLASLRSLEGEQSEPAECLAAPRVFVTYRRLCTSSHGGLSLSHIVTHVKVTKGASTQGGMWGAPHFSSPRNTETLLGVHCSATLGDVTQEAAAPLCGLLSPHLHHCPVLCGRHTSRHAQRPAWVAGSKTAAQISLCSHWPLHSPYPM